MASTIYRFQITREDSELNRQLVAAMCNEMTHYQDFQVKLYEFGLRPSMPMNQTCLSVCFSPSSG